MVVVMIILGSIVAILALGFLLFLYLDWLDHKGKCARIKFKDFKKFYELNPDRWFLSDYYVECKIDKRNSEPFEFSFIDLFQYDMWSCSEECKKQDAKYAASTQRMLDAVKEDIAKAKEKEQTNKIDLFTKELENVPSLIKALEEHGVYLNVKEK